MVPKLSYCDLLTIAIKTPFNITVGSSPQLIGFIRFGEPVPHGLSAHEF